MKIFKRIFVFPILIQKTHIIYIENAVIGGMYEDIYIPKKEGFDISLHLRKHKMGGTMKTTSYVIRIIINGKEFQRTFVWRPDVTRYWWKKGV